MSFLMVLSAFVPVSSFYFLIECCDKNVCLLMYKLSNFYDVYKWCCCFLICMVCDKFVILQLRYSTVNKSSIFMSMSRIGLLTIGFQTAESLSNREILQS